MHTEAEYKYVKAGHRLRGLRLDSGLSLRGAAAQIGIKEWTLRSAEQGKHRPQPSNALRIAEFYDTKPTMIWRQEEEGERVNLT